MKQLLVRPLPADDESAQGYLLRLAAANVLANTGALHPEHLHMHDSQAKLRGPINGIKTLNRPDPGGLPVRHWNTRRPRYCPACLTESGHWRAAWSLNFCVACPLHKVMLVDDCHRCSRPLKWHRTQVAQCACGADLRQREAVGAGEHAINLACQIAAFLREPLKAQESARGLQLLLERAWLLGAYRLQLTTRAQKVGGLHEIARAARIVDSASRVVDDWPHSYFQFLEDVASRYGRPGSSSIMSHFGPLYRELFRGDRHGFNSDLRDGFEAYLRTRWRGQLARRNRRLSADAVDAHAWVPITAAAKAIGWSIARVRQGIADGKIRGTVQARPSGRMTGVVHRDELVRLQQMEGTSLDLLSACRALRVGKKRIHELMELGKLRPLSGPSVDGRKTWVFHRLDVEQLGEFVASRR
ncbi:TniQ family protein [Roseateles sp. L2-2]|uniref:TniQ family protein n=1 Tax=Roseateles sp. L2-2 TaxID=3422597 RepID=UPI003D36A6F4